MSDMQLEQRDWESACRLLMRGPDADIAESAAALLDMFDTGKAIFEPEPLDLDDSTRYFAPDGPYWLDAEIAADNSAREDQNRYEGTDDDAACDFDAEDA
jgi:hypothetical protein